MANTLVKGATTITPTLVKPYGYSRPSKTVVHIIPGQVADSYTLAPAGKRQGDLELVFAAVGDAHAAEVALATSGVWTYTDPGNTNMNMTLIVAGAIAPAQQDSLTTWLLVLPFKEV